MMAEAARVMIASTASGGGKTTITCGLLRALTRRSLRLAAAKCGPDYLDPQFHRAVLGVPSRNLDLFLGQRSLARWLVAEGARDADLTIIEGVMGYYDGIAQSADASSFDVARATETPAVLVVDARGRSLSVAAEVAGFAHLRNPSQVAGVILNHASASYAPALAAMVEHECGLPVLGFVPELAQAHLKSRHLGLVAAAEVADLEARVDVLADQLEKSVDLDALVALAQSAALLDVAEPSLPASFSAKTCPDAPIIAVARDEAFSFYYDDTLALLERLGARLAFFSPLRDAHLPAGTCGLYLGGGYPELHARELSANAALRSEVAAAVASGMPTIAECGGYLYLLESLADETGQTWPMVGAVPGHAARGARRGNFGYAALTARFDNLLAARGETLPAHEFHAWQSDASGDAFHAQKPQSERAWDCVVATPTLYAGFPHLYLCGSPHAAARFVCACAAMTSIPQWDTGHCGTAVT